MVESLDVEPHQYGGKQRPEFAGWSGVIWSGVIWSGVGCCEIRGHSLEFLADLLAPS